MAHPQRVCWGISAPGLLWSRTCPGGVFLLWGLGAPLEFEFDVYEEFTGCRWSSKSLDLQQRLAQFDEVVCRHEGPPSEGVEYPVPALWSDSVDHAASLAVRSGWRYPCRASNVTVVVSMSTATVTAILAVIGKRPLRSSDGRFLDPFQSSEIAGGSQSM